MKRLICVFLVLTLVGIPWALPARAEEAPPVPETTETLPAETIQSTACTEEAELPPAAAEATQASTLPPDTEPAETKRLPPPKPFRLRFPQPNLPSKPSSPRKPSPLPRWKSRYP